MTGLKMWLIGVLALVASGQAGAAMVKPPPAIPDPAATLVQYNASGMMTPPQGSPLRRELMDTMRPVFMQEIGGEIEFFVHRLVVRGDWAYAVVRPQRPGGQRINWARTKFANEARAGSFNTEDSAALMRLRNGRWMLVEHVIGPTDVFWIGWQQDHQLPEEMFTGQ